MFPRSPNWAPPFGRGDSPRFPRLRPRGPGGRAPRWRDPDAAPRLHQPRWRKPRAPLEPGSRPLEGPQPPLGAALGAAVVLLRSLFRPPSPSLHPASPLPSTIPWSSTVDGVSTPQPAPSLRPTGAGPAAGGRAEGRGAAARPGPGVPGEATSAVGLLFCSSSTPTSSAHVRVLCHIQDSMARSKRGLCRLTLAVVSGITADGVYKLVKYHYR